MLTKLEIAKELAFITVSAACAKVIERLVVNNTDLDEDTKGLNFGCSVGGFLIANRFRKQSDDAVEWAAVKLIQYKESRNAKKDQPQSEIPS